MRNKSLRNSAFRSKLCQFLGATSCIIKSYIGQATRAYTLSLIKGIPCITAQAGTLFVLSFAESVHHSAFSVVEAVSNIAGSACSRFIIGFAIGRNTLACTVNRHPIRTTFQTNLTVPVPDRAPSISWLAIFG